VGVNKMKKNIYLHKKWIIFKNSGSIADYLAYRLELRKNIKSEGNIKK
jgi:hypothetical protein